MSVSAATMTEEQPYTVNEVAHILRVTPRTVRNMIRDGELAAFMVRSEYRIMREALRIFQSQDTSKRKAIRLERDPDQGDSSEAGA